MNPFSKYAYWLCVAVLTYTAFFFYPKWEKSGSEATLSWDVCGYYYYLPAIFIYKDLKNVAFHTHLDKKYQYQGGDFYAALPLSSPPSVVEGSTPPLGVGGNALTPPLGAGGLVMKYPSGMAIMYVPAFFAAHLLAKPLGYEADGFSKPYQMVIGIWSLLWAFVGLWFLRKVLLKVRFNDKSVAFTLILYVFATHYLNYAAIDSAMTHSYIFTLYAILLWFILKFEETQVASSLAMTRTAICMGICIGLAALARPTELIVILIPILWGVSNFEGMKMRFAFLKKHISMVFITAAVAFLIGFIQLIYWKYTTGHFIYNSYGPEDKMEWLHTHIIDGMFSARKGWLVYTPAMLFSLIGFVFLYKKRRDYFWTIGIFTVLFIYVSFAHNIWWYGGGLGQRQMIQIYPMLAFPLAAFFDYVLQNKIWRIIVSISMLVCIYLNIWLLYQAHKGGHFEAEYTTPAYLRATLGRWNIPDDTRKLLDNKYDFQGTMLDVNIIYKNDFENDTAQSIVNQNVINGNKSLSVDKQHPYSPKIDIPLLPRSARSDNGSIKNKKWLRATATFRAVSKEWNTWSMMQWIVTLKKGEQEVKSFYLRPHRIMNDGETKKIWLDAKIQRYNFDKISISFWNTDSEKQMLIDDLMVEAFNE